MKVLFNNILEDFPSFSEEIFEKGKSVYEVVRIFNSKPLFLQDNTSRLSSSLEKLGFESNRILSDFEKDINYFIDLENIKEGNIKYILHYSIEGEPNKYIYQIPHSYPTAKDYEEGVEGVTLLAERHNPQIKYINTQLRAITDKIIKDKGIYEVILIDNEGYISEGSRSNIFFIKDNLIYTTPLAYVLAGTSRKRVFDICYQQNWEIKEKRIKYSQINTYNSCFITGTSPLILPLKKIDNIEFNPHNSLLRKLMKTYFSLIK